MASLCTPCLPWGSGLNKLFFLIFVSVPLWPCHLNTIIVCPEAILFSFPKLSNLAFPSFSCHKFASPCSDQHLCLCPFSTGHHPLSLPPVNRFVSFYISLNQRKQRGVLSLHWCSSFCEMPRVAIKCCENSNHYISLWQWPRREQEINVNGTSLVGIKDLMFETLQVHGALQDSLN